MGQPEEYMKMALTLAERGIGTVEPNPAVGCVIVKDGKVIGTGWHEKFGGPHAEVNALADCQKNGSDPSGATMYVTLEPCCHVGKTLACTEAIKSAKIGKVVAAMKDPTPKVAGKGFEILRDAGIEVDVGLCLDEAIRLNSAFVKYAWTSMPWVVVKWAQSKDGFLARADGKRWISGRASRDDVQKIRSCSQAVLVGINTVLKDDPMLTVRLRENAEILRVVLDSKLQMSLDSKLLKSVGKSGVLIFTSAAAIQKNSDKVEAIKSFGGEVIAIENSHAKCNIEQAVDAIGQKGCQQLLVEGGVEVINSFLDGNLVDEAIVYITDEKLGRAGRV